MTIPLGRMEATARGAPHTIVTLMPALTHRNRLTAAFRPILAIPHVLLVGAPTAFGLSLGWRLANGPTLDWSAGTGVLGLVASVAALIGWFAILFTGRYPNGLWELAAYYLRWRVRAIAYIALLSDEYPPFGDAPYPARVELFPPDGPRNRLTTAFRIFLLIPHFAVLWILSVIWLITTILAWLSILFTGKMPVALAEFGTGMLRWAARVEAHLLLLHDEYPPFSLD